MHPQDLSDQLASRPASRRRRSALALGAALLALRAWSAPEAAREGSDLELERVASGEEEVVLVDRLYPASGNPQLRRSALELAARYFPTDGNTQFRVGVRLALLDWTDGHPRPAQQRLAKLLARDPATIDPSLYSWAEIVEGRLMADLGQGTAARALLDRVALDRSLPNERRTAAAAAAADLRAAVAPGPAVDWLDHLTSSGEIHGPVAEAAMARLLLLGGRPEDLDQRLTAIAEDPAQGDRGLAALLDAAERWDIEGDGPRLTALAGAITRLRPDAGAELRNSLARARTAATALSLQTRLGEILRRKPVAEWSKGLPADSVADLEEIGRAIDQAAQRGEPERCLRLSLRALASQGADASLPKRIFAAAQYADWVERTHPGAIDPQVGDGLLGLCDLLPTSNPYFVEGKFLAAARAARQGNAAGERAALAEVTGLADLSPDYLAPACRKLGANLEQAGEYRQALEVYLLAEPVAATHRAAAQCVLHAVWINLSLGTDHEARRLLALLAKSPGAVTGSMPGGDQLRELEVLVKGGQADECWSAGRAWWPEWARLALGLGAPPNLLEYGVPEIADIAALENAIRQAAQAGDGRTYMRDLSILMSAARWQPSLGAEAASLCAAAVKSAGDSGVDLRGLLIRMLASPHPAEIPGGRERRLCLALNYLDVRQPVEALRVAAEFAAAAQPEDSTTRAMHRIRALAALAANQAYAESAAGLEADLADAHSDGQRAMSVGLLSDLYRRMGRDADSASLVRRELADPAVATDPEGRAALESKLGTVLASESRPPPVARWVKAVGLGWYGEAEPRDLQDPRIAGNPNALATIDKLFGPVEQVKYLLLAANDPRLQSSEQNRLFIEGAVRIMGWSRSYRRLDLLAAAIVNEPAFDPQVRLGILWNILSLLGREGRKAEYGRWRDNPLCQRLSPDFRARLALLDREVAMDRASAPAIRSLAEAVAAQPLSAAGALLERDAFDALVRVGGVTEAAALEGESAHWAFVGDAAASADALRLELARKVRVAGALNPIHEALAAATLDRFPGPGGPLPEDYADLRIDGRLPALGPEETFRAGLDLIASRGFGRQDLQFWGTFLRAWPHDRANAVGSVVRAGLRAAEDDQVRSQVIVLFFTSFDVDDPEVRLQLEREFAPYRPAAENPSCNLTIRLYEIDRDLRLGRAIDLETAFNGLADPRAAVVRERACLRHYTQAADRLRVRQTLDQIDPPQLLSPGFLPDAIPALVLVGTSGEIGAARAAGTRILRQEILASWAGADEASADAALDLALALGDQARIPAGWVTSLADSADPLVAARARLVQAVLAGNWMAVDTAAAALNAQYPNRFGFYWYRGLALHRLGRDHEAAAALQPYLDHARDELNYPQALLLAKAIGPAGS